MTSTSRMRGRWMTWLCKGQCSRQTVQHKTSVQVSVCMQKGDRERKYQKTNLVGGLFVNSSEFSLVVQSSWAGVVGEWGIRQKVCIWTVNQWATSRSWEWERCSSVRKASCEPEAERQEAKQKTHRRQKEWAASQTSSAQAFTCPKCRRVWASRIWLYSHQQDARTDPQPSQNPCLWGSTFTIRDNQDEEKLVLSFLRNLKTLRWFGVLVLFWTFL